MKLRILTNLTLCTLISAAAIGCGGDDDTPVVAPQPTEIDDNAGGPASDPAPLPADDSAGGDGAGGGGGLSAEEQAVVDAWVAETQRDARADGEPALEAEFRCGLEKTVPVFGAAKAQSYLDQDLQYEGNSQNELMLEAADARILADNFASCLSVESLAAVYASAGMTPDQAACFAETLHPQFAEIVYVGLTGGDEESVVDLVALAGQCGLT